MEWLLYSLINLYCLYVYSFDSWRYTMLFCVNKKVLFFLSKSHVLYLYMLYCTDYTYIVMLKKSSDIGHSNLILVLRKCWYVKCFIVIWNTFYRILYFSKEVISSLLCLNINVPNINVLIIVMFFCINQIYMYPWSYLSFTFPINQLNYLTWVNFKY